MEIINLDPMECRPHPLLARMAMEKETIEYLEADKESDPAKESRRVKRLAERKAARAAFLASVAAEGVRDHVKVVKVGDSWLIADGRHRWEAACLAGKTLPAVEVTEEEARRTILDNMALRRHLGKSSTAWLVVSLHPYLADRKPGGDHSDKIGMSREDHAQANGISADLIDQACTLWTMTAKMKAKRTSVDAAISSGKSLGGLIAGLKAPESFKELRPGEQFGARTPTQASLRRNVTALGTQLSTVARLSPAHHENAKRMLARLIRDNATVASLFAEAAELAADSDDDLTELAVPKAHVGEGLQD